jgi:hypothetical protein
MPCPIQDQSVNAFREIMDIYVTKHSKHTNALCDKIRDLNVITGNMLVTAGL